MEGNRYLGATPPGPPPNSPQGWSYFGPPPRQQSWVIPAAIVVAATIIATSVLAGILLTRGDTATPDQSASTASGSTSTAGETTTSENLNSSTRRAWGITSAAMRVSQGLPSEWTWETPNIDLYIDQYKASDNALLDIFERQIRELDPEAVQNAAHTYISVRREQNRKLEDRTFTMADSAPVTVAAINLDNLCGVKLDF